MKLLAKFNLIFVLVFGAGLGVAGFLSWHFLQENARVQVMQQARLMMAAALSARDYTSKQIKPLLMDNAMHRENFLPQTVPAYAAVESFGYLRAHYPDYAYKEATLNPTNLRDRAMDWEADVVNEFRNHAGTEEVTGERDTPTGKALFLARPIAVAPPCLSCHDTADDAPPAMIKHYGSANGFGWHAGDIVGAQIVSVPMTVPIEIADRAFRGILLYLAGIFLVTILLLNLLLIVTIIQPVATLSDMANQISTGNMDVAELPIHGRDEIAVLAGSFNRMRRSLEHAIKMLGEQ